MSRAMIECAAILAGWCLGQWLYVLIQGWRDERNFRRFMAATLDPRRLAEQEEFMRRVADNDYAAPDMAPTTVPDSTKPA